MYAYEPVCVCMWNELQLMESNDEWKTYVRMLTHSSNWASSHILWLEMEKGTWMPMLCNTQMLNIQRYNTSNLIVYTKNVVKNFMAGYCLFIKMNLCVGWQRMYCVESIYLYCERERSFACRIWMELLWDLKSLFWLLFGAYFFAHASQK